MSSLLSVHRNQVLLAHSQPHSSQSLMFTAGFCNVSSFYRVIVELLSHVTAQTFYWLSSPCLYSLFLYYVPCFTYSLIALSFLRNGPTAQSFKRHY